MEMLRLVVPDLILVSQFYDYQRPILERIAEVESLATYEAGHPPYPLAVASALRLGRLLDRSAAAEALVEASERGDFRMPSPAGASRRSTVIAISLGDSRHFRAFGADSMFGDVLVRLGLRNAWTDPTSYSAAAPIALEVLAQVPDASIVVVEPLPPEVGRALPNNALWHALPAVREGPRRDHSVDQSLRRPSVRCTICP